MIAQSPHSGQHRRRWHRRESSRRAVESTKLSRQLFLMTENGWWNNFSTTLHALLPALQLLWRHKVPPAYYCMPFEVHVTPQITPEHAGELELCQVNTHLLFVNRVSLSIRYTHLTASQPPTLTNLSRPGPPALLVHTYSSSSLLGPARNDGVRPHQHQGFSRFVPYAGIPASDDCNLPREIHSWVREPGTHTLGYAYDTSIALQCICR